MKYNIKILVLLSSILISGCATYPSNVNINLQPGSVLVIPTYQIKGYNNYISYSPALIFHR